MFEHWASCEEQRETNARKARSIDVGYSFVFSARHKEKRPPSISMAFSLIADRLLFLLLLLAHSGYEVCGAIVQGGHTARKDGFEILSLREENLDADPYVILHHV